MNEINWEDQSRIWDFYKPRHTHSWNMLVLSWRALESLTNDTNPGFLSDYCWENFIIRLWLYRTTVSTLTKLPSVKGEARNALNSFDESFVRDGQNSLRALRNMIEHFDDYAAGDGRGPASREKDLDPFRSVTHNRYERGRWLLTRATSYDAAIVLREDAKRVSDKFIELYKANDT